MTNKTVASARLTALAVALALTALAGVAAPAAATGDEHSLWPDSATPQVITDEDAASVELGVQFQSDRDGRVIGLEFYKGPENLGTHTGALWTSTGTKLAEVTFTDETATGWQRALFPEPVSIAADTLYVISYHAPQGRYSSTARYFTERDVTSGPLTAPSSTVERLNGVYAYGEATTFPTASYGDNNYWVDVLFSDTAIPGAPQGLRAAPYRDAVKITWNASAAPDARIAEYAVLRDGIELARVSADEDRTYVDRAGLADSTIYSYQVRAIDSRGLPSPVSTAMPVAYVAPRTIWPDGSLSSDPVSHADAHPIELGVKFTSSVTGEALGVRFFKGTDDDGPHTGSLWGTDGTRLATVTFEEATDEGWQLAYFDSPVETSANTVYVVSYHTESGNYAAESGYFHDRSVTNGPLTALANHTAGVNGVFRYGASAYPDGSYEAANYWVDVVFRPSLAAALPTVPATITASQNQHEVTVAWSPSTRTLHPVTGYEVFRDGESIASVDASTLQLIDDGLRADRVYDYRVRAVDAVGGASDLSVAARFTYLAPSVPTAVEALPRVPWEGGPAFYERFPQAVASGWTDPSFFPIGMWGAGVENERDVLTDKAAGINTYLELYKGDGVVFPNFTAIRDNGMFAIHGLTDAPDLGDETVGWFIADELEGRVPEHTVLEELKRIESAMPDDGRLRFSNFTGALMLPNFMQRPELAPSWMDVSDINSLDIYWYARDLLCAGSVGGEVWRDGSGAPQRAGGGFNDLSEAECHRASNYGRQIDEQRRVSARSGAVEPVWTFVELGNPFPEPEVRGISPEQIPGAVWNSLIHEARGVNYFNHSFSGPCPSSNILRDPLYWNRDCYQPVRDVVTELNAQIRELAPVLNTQSFEYSFNPKLDTMLKEHDGSYYVFAMPSGVKYGSATGTQTLRLPLGIDASSAEVLFEDRTVDIHDGEITDTFEADYTFHIYKITPAAIG